MHEPAKEHGDISKNDTAYIETQSSGTRQSAFGTTVQFE